MRDTYYYSVYICLLRIGYVTNVKPNERFRVPHRLVAADLFKFLRLTLVFFFLGGRGDLYLI